MSSRVLAMMVSIGLLASAVLPPTASAQFDGDRELWQLPLDTRSRIEANIKNADLVAIVQPLARVGDLQTGHACVAFRRIYLGEGEAGELRWVPRMALDRISTSSDAQLIAWRRDEDTPGGWRAGRAIPGLPPIPDDLRNSWLADVERIVRRLHPDRHRLPTRRAIAVVPNEASVSETRKAMQQAVDAIARGGDDSEAAMQTLIDGGEMADRALLDAANDPGFARPQVAQRLLALRHGGEPLNGLRLRLRMGERESDAPFRAGQTVPLTVEFANLTSEPIELDLRGRRHFLLRLRSTDWPGQLPAIEPVWDRQSLSVPAYGVARLPLRLGVGRSSNGGLDSVLQTPWGELPIDGKRMRVELFYQAIPQEPASIPLPPSPALEADANDIAKPKDGPHRIVIRKFGEGDDIRRRPPAKPPTSDGPRIVPSGGTADAGGPRIIERGPPSFEVREATPDPRTQVERSGPDFVIKPGTPLPPRDEPLQRALPAFDHPDAWAGGRLRSNAVELRFDR